jgi:hypothetical protein
MPYTVIFTTSPLNLTLPHSPSTKSAPHEQTEVGSFYTPEFAQEAVRMDLKRDLRPRAPGGGIPQKTEQKDFRPLFETYQFLTPGMINASWLIWARTNGCHRIIHGHHSRNLTTIYSRRRIECDFESTGVVWCV